MSKTINTIEFQTAILEEAKANGHTVRLFHTYCSDYDRVEASRLELVEGTYWEKVHSINGPNGQVPLGHTRMLASSCFVTLSLSNCRRLVSSKSHEIFITALEASGMFKSG